VPIITFRTDAFQQGKNAVTTKILVVTTYGLWLDFFEFFFKKPEICGKFAQKNLISARLETTFFREKTDRNIRKRICNNG